MTDQSVLYNHASNYGAQGVFHDAVTMNVTVTEGGTYLQQAQHPPTIERYPSSPRPPRALRSFRNREHALDLLRAELRADGAAWLNGWRGAGLTALLTQVGALASGAATSFHHRAVRCQYGRLCAVQRSAAVHIDAHTSNAGVPPPYRSARAGPLYPWNPTESAHHPGEMRY